jgi:hypothetical protein
MPEYKIRAVFSALVFLGEKFSQENSFAQKKFSAGK